MYIPHGRPQLEVSQADGRTRLRKHAVGGPVFGTRLAARLLPSVGVEGSFAYSPALIAVRSFSGAVEDQSANLVLASVRALLRLEQDGPRKIGLQLGSGVGMVRRGGDAWADTPAPVRVAFVMSAAARAQLDPRSGMEFRMELEDYVSSARFDLRGGGQSSGRAYHDVIWSLGVSIPIAGRR
jgi:hypothetical protein